MQRFAIVLLLFAILWAISGLKEVNQKNKEVTKKVAKASKKVSAAEKNLLKKPNLEDIAPDKVKKLNQLKLGLKESKAKAKAIGLNIAVAKPEEVQKLEQEKNEVKEKCLSLKQQIENTKAQLKKLQDDFAFKCANQFEIKIQKAKKRIAFLIPKIKELTVKMSKKKVEIKDAPTAKKTELKKQYKEMKKEKAKLVKEKKRAFKFVTSAVELKARAGLKNAKIELAIETRKLNKAADRFERAKKRVDDISAKIDELKASLCKACEETKQTIRKQITTLVEKKREAIKYKTDSWTWLRLKKKKSKLSRRLLRRKPSKLHALN